jgi:hypothetical protein
VAPGGGVLIKFTVWDSFMPCARTLGRYHTDMSWSSRKIPVLVRKDSGRFR